MAQLTLRIPDELAADLRRAARTRDQSVNSWATSVLRAAVDPDTADSEAERLRERLQRAGLLHQPQPRGSGLSDPEALAEAKAAAGRGKTLSEYVSEGRR